MTKYPISELALHSPVCETKRILKEKATNTEHNSNTLWENKKIKNKNNKKYSLFCVYSAYSIACSWSAVTVHKHGLLHNRLKTLTISHYSADFITEHPSFPEKPLKRKNKQNH